MDLWSCFFVKQEYTTYCPQIQGSESKWVFNAMVRDHEEKIRVLTKPLQTRGEKKQSAVQFSNRTGGKAVRLRLLKTVSTVTAAHDEQHRGRKTPAWAAPSLPACADAPQEGLSWNIYRGHWENGQCEEYLDKHEQNSSVVLLWGGITDPPSAPGAALARHHSWLRCISARRVRNLVIANAYCCDACGFLPLSCYILFPLVNLIYVLCSFLAILFKIPS